MELAKQESIIDDVANILADSPPSNRGECLDSSLGTEVVETILGWREGFANTSGCYLGTQFNGNEIVDSAGHRLGGDDPDAFHNQIPNGRYEHYFDMRLAIVEQGDDYTINVFGTKDGEATVRLRTYTQDGISQEINFLHVPTTSSSHGTLTFTHN